MIESEFMSRTKFTQIIEKEVRENNLNYIDATVRACEITNIDPEDVKKFISPLIKEKIENEAMNLNFLPRQNQLIFE
jgi:MinD-like ATPase involved in chromosome partitioning or flagellar assembly